MGSAPCRRWAASWAVGALEGSLEEVGAWAASGEVACGAYLGVEEASSYLQGGNRGYLSTNSL